MAPRPFRKEQGQEQAQASPAKGLLQLSWAWSPGPCVPIPVLEKDNDSTTSHSINHPFAPAQGLICAPGKQRLFLPVPHGVADAKANLVEQSSLTARV